MLSPDWDMILDVMDFSLLLESTSHFSNQTQESILTNILGRFSRGAMQYSMILFDTSTPHADRDFALESRPISTLHQRYQSTSRLHGTSRWKTWQNALGHCNKRSPNAVIPVAFEYFCHEYRHWVSPNVKASLAFPCC